MRENFGWETRLHMTYIDLMNFELYKYINNLLETELFSIKYNDIIIKNFYLYLWNDYTNLT